jgi:hypothetical protein
MYESTKNLILSAPVFEALALIAFVLILNLAS